jgi:ATP-dependent RNA helicase DHX8/PRP22
LEKSKNANAKEKTMEKALNRWCWENFINHRSLRHARDVHRLVIFVLMEGLNCWVGLR